MALKRLPTPNSDAGNWGVILNEFIQQLSPSSKGGINVWTTSTRPGSLTVDDEGRTGVNTDTNVIERWNGTAWVSILSNPTPSVANGTTTGYLSSVDWTTFNNKQNKTAITVGLAGTGADYILDPAQGQIAIQSALDAQKTNNLPILVLPMSFEMTAPAVLYKNSHIFELVEKTVYASPATTFAAGSGKSNHLFQAADFVADTVVDSYAFNLNFDGKGRNVGFFYARPIKGNQTTDRFLNNIRQTTANAGSPIAANAQIATVSAGEDILYTSLKVTSTADTTAPVTIGMGTFLPTSRTVANVPVSANFTKVATLDFEEMVTDVTITNNLTLIANNGNTRGIALMIIAKDATPSINLNPTSMVPLVDFRWINGEQTVTITRAEMIKSVPDKDQVDIYAVDLKDKWSDFTPSFTVSMNIIRAVPNIYPEYVVPGRFKLIKTGITGNNTTLVTLREDYYIESVTIVSTQNLTVRIGDNFTQAFASIVLVAGVSQTLTNPVRYNEANPIPVVTDLKLETTNGSSFGGASVDVTIQFGVKVILEGGLYQERYPLAANENVYLFATSGSLSATNLETTVDVGKISRNIDLKYSAKNVAPTGDTGLVHITTGTIFGSNVLNVSRGRTKNLTIDYEVESTTLNGNSATSRLNSLVLRTSNLYDLTVKYKASNTHGNGILWFADGTENKAIYRARKWNVDFDLENTKLGDFTGSGVDRRKSDFDDETRTRGYEFTFTGRIDESILNRVGINSYMNQFAADPFALGQDTSSISCIQLHNNRNTRISVYFRECYAPIDTGYDNPRGFVGDDMIISDCTFDRCHQVGDLDGCLNKVYRNNTFIKMDLNGKFNDYGAQLATEWDGNRFIDCGSRNTSVSNKKCIMNIRSGGTKFINNIIEFNQQTDVEYVLFIESGRAGIRTPIVIDGNEVVGLYKPLKAVFGLHTDQYYVIQNNRGVKEDKIYAYFSGNQNTESISGQSWKGIAVHNTMTSGKLVKDQKPLSDLSLLNPQADWDAAYYLSTNSSDVVSQLTDKIGNNNMTQSSQAVRPVIDRKTENGKYALRFYGEVRGQYLTSTNSVIGVGSAYDIFVVSSRASGTSGYMLGDAGTNNTANNRFHFGYTSDTNIKLSQFGSDLNVGVSSFSTPVWYVWEAAFDPAVGHYIYQNNVLKNSDTNTAGMAVANSLRIGSGISDGFDGWIARVVAFNRVLTTKERNYMYYNLAEYATDEIPNIDSDFPDSVKLYGVYADNASAVAAGLLKNQIYKTSTGEIRIVI